MSKRPSKRTRQTKAVSAAVSGQGNFVVGIGKGIKFKTNKTSNLEIGQIEEDHAKMAAVVHLHFICFAVAFGNDHMSSNDLSA